MENKNIVLIVDDNIENLNVLSEILEKKGYIVHIAINGADALKSISISLPHLILLDINMPGMSGYEVCSKLKSNEQTAAIPIIFLSALTEMDDMVKAFEIGGLDYITKPFYPELVSARVKTHIELYKIKQNLEKIVEDRTAELRMVNEELLSTSESLKENYIELEEAKEKVDERENQLRSIADNLVNGMIFQVIMIDENNRKFTYLSDTVNKFYGCTEEEAKADSNLIYSKVHKDDLARLKVKEFEALKSWSVFKTEVRLITNNGSMRWAYLVSSPRENKGIVYWDGIEIDITDQKHVEQELIKARDKAEESDHLKTAFLQNLSHEIRTPMNAIMGFSGFLSNPELNDEKRKSFVSIIQSSSNQLLSIVTDILTISSIETKQEKVNISKISINDLIVDLLTIFKVQALNRNISLYLKQQLTNEQSEVFSDGIKITQILTNLITNALKFTHEGFIEFGYVLIPAINNNKQTNDTLESELQFYVKDTGIGIKPENQNEIFERFRQADLNINKKYGGTGLGLSISKGFVELLGGKIWVESELQKGSTFYFTIPYHPVNEPKLNLTADKQIQNPSTIVVAEDDEFNFLLIEEILNEMDYKIIHVKNGQECIEICKENKQIGLVLMDIKMAIMDGYTAALKIKEFLPALPIIAQSAYALEHEIEQFSGNAFDDYITKPINESELKQKVKKYFKP